MFFTTIRTDNLFTLWLDLLQVKHTHSYASQLYHEHPYYNNLLGISQMLYNYKISNTAVELAKKEDVLLLEVPFIANFANDLVLVYKLTETKVSYKTVDDDIQISLEDFYNQFTGVVLVAEPDADSEEPFYSENRKKESFTHLLKAGLLVATAMLITGVFRYHHFYESFLTTFLLVLNFIGIYIGYLLILKQMRIQSRYADKICTLFKESSCNNVLESKQAKLFGQGLRI